MNKDRNPLKKFLNKFEDALIDHKCKTIRFNNDFLPNMPPSKLKEYNRIIVIGDIHGDFDKLIKCLIIANVINNKHEWIGEEGTYIVQVGDQIDSCRPTNNYCNVEDKTDNSDKAEDILILEFLTNLHRQAEKKKSGVYSLIGNHELMNVEGDMTYVSYKNLIDTKLGNIKNDDIFQARKNAFKPGSKYANFLACTRPMSIVIGDNLFVHAGIIPEIAKKYNIEDMNKLLQLYLLGFLKNKNLEKEELDIIETIFNSPNESPLWNRVFGSSNNIDSETCDKYLNPLKEFYQVGKIYVGHTPQIKNGITSTCNEKIWLTDVGLSKVFNKFDPTYKQTKKNISPGRKAQVLEIKKINGKDTFKILK